MSVENEGQQPANDTAVTDPNVGAPPIETTADDAEPELDDNGDPVVDNETMELEFDGKKWIVAKDVAITLKPALLRQADYTKKTQEIADRARALELQEQGLKTQTEAQKAHFKTATKLAGLGDRIASGVQGIAYDKIDWRGWQALDPDNATAAWREYEILKSEWDAAARDFSQKEQERIESANRESGTRVQTVQAEIARLIPEWTPRGELDVKLQKYGNANGYTDEVMTQATLLSPRFAYDLNRLRLMDEAAAKQKTQQTFDKTQIAQPVTRVGGASGTATRKTTDSSGDALSNAEWVRREQERVAKLRPAIARR